MSVSATLSCRSLFTLIAFLGLAVIPGALLAQLPAVTATKNDGVGAATRILPGSTVRYTNTISNSGAGSATGVTFSDPDVANTTLVPGSVHISPLAMNDSYQVLANTVLNVDDSSITDTQVSTTTKLGANDTTLNAPGGTDTSSIVSHTNPANGTLLSFNNSTGAFAYVPTAGYVGTDTFNYTVQNNADTSLTDTATVTIMVLDTNPTVAGNQKIWYVKNDVATSGTGRANDPFKTLAAAQTASAVGDTIYVFNGDGTTTGQNAGIVLKSDQRLLGEGVALAVPVSLTQQGGAAGPNPTNLRAAGTKPRIGNATGDAVAATNVIPAEIQGLSISASNNAIDLTYSSVVTAATCQIKNNVIFSAGAEGIDINKDGNFILGLDVQNNSWNLAGTHTGNGFDLNRPSSGSPGSVRLVFSGNSVISSAAAVFVTGNSGVTVTGFLNNTVSGDTGGNGLSLSDVAFDADPATAGYQTVSGGTTVIGTSGNPVGGGGLLLTLVRGDLSFTDVDSFTGGTAMFLSGNGGPVNIAAGTGMRLTVGSGVASFVSTGGAAVIAANATIDIQNVLVTSTNSLGNGVSLSNTSNGTTNSTFSTTTGSSITNALDADFACTSNNANVSYSGTITDDVGVLVSLSGNTGGIKSFSGAITDGNDGDGSGITLTNNGGTTINFSGGLTLSTGANPAFAATGGGTLNVTQNNTSIVNTIATTTGTALNIASTDIGASGVTFRSISSNGGGSSGIVLNTTGSAGGLTVTGNGGSGGTNGGTINNKSTNGITLTSTGPVSLTNMTVDTNTGSGIAGTTVNGLSLTNCVISNNADTADGSEAGIRLTGFTGTSAWSNVTFTNSSEDHVRITNSSGTLTGLTLTGCTFNANNAATGGHGISMINTSTAVATLSVTSTNFTGIRGSAVLVNGTNTTVSNASVSGGTFTNTGDAVTLQTDASADLTFSVTGITATGSISNAIQLVAGSTSLPASNIVGTIANNTIGNATVDSGSRDLYGIALDLRGDQDSIISVTGNNIRHTDINGIFISQADFGSVSGPSARLDLHLRNNTVGNIDDNSAFPFFSVYGTLVDIRHTTSAYLDVAGNTSTSIGGLEHFRFRQRDTSLVYVERLTDGDGTAGELINTVATLENFFAAQNSGGSTADVTVVAGMYEAADGIARDPLLFAPAEVESTSFAGAQPDSVESAKAWTETVRQTVNRQPAVATAAPQAPEQNAPALAVAAAPPGSPAVPAALSQSELDNIVSAARTRWHAAGLSAEQKAHLSSLRFEVADLAGWHLGENGSDLIRIDTDAGGNGWFVDSTPADDSEFSGSALLASQSQPAALVSDRIDLLTTVLHEMGHSLGLCDTYSRLQRNSVMYGFLTKGERRLPAQGQAVGATPHAHATPHHLSAPISIGTLPPGKSVTIAYSVVINDPPPAGSTTSQGTVSGSNFANVLTDDVVSVGDPLLPGAADPTVTLIDLPDVNVAVVPASRLEDSGLGLTYTFTRGGSTASALSVNFAVTGTAILSTNDFTVAVPVGSSFNGANGTGTVVIPIGQSSASITLTPSSDTTVEPDETVIVSIASSATYDVGAASSATGTITNDDSEIAVTVSPASVIESSGSGLTYTFTRTGYTDNAVTANFSVGGTATLGGSAPANDFTASGATTFTSTVGTVAFAIGDTTKTVTVTPVDDSIDENDETVILTMTSGTGYNVAGTAATGTINDNDAAPTVSINSPTAIAEGDSGTKTLGFTVSLTSPSAKSITVNYATANGSASSASDYVSSSGTLTFAAGETSKTVNVTINGDTLNEANETFTVTLTGPTNAALGTATGTGTINNDDPVPTLAINDVTQLEGDSGTTNFVFTVSLSAPSGQTITVDYATADGTALQPGDYASASGTLTFSASVTSRTITVLVNGNTTWEADEAFVVNLSNPTNATISDGQAVGAITNDDLPQVSVSTTITAGDDDAAEGGVNNGVYTFTRDSTVGALTVNFQLDASSTAVAGTDFNLTGTASFSIVSGAGTVAFADGVGTVVVSLVALTESPNGAEAAETARLNVVTSPGVYVAGTSPNATVTIGANSFLVTNTADSGTGSLRQAVDNANTIAGTDTITFDATAFATAQIISLTSGHLMLTSNVSITGPGANLLTVRNGAGSGTENRVFRLDSATTTTLRGLTIADGRAGFAAGIDVLGSGGAPTTLNLISCTVSGNTSGSYAGGIAGGPGSVVNIVNSTISGNIGNTTNGTGGGIDFGGSILRVINSTISGNSTPNGNSNGGGIAIYSGAATILNSTITNNTAVGASSGGGVLVYGSAAVGGAVTVGNSIIAGNQNNGTRPDIFKSAVAAAVVTSSGGNVVGNPGAFTGFNQTGDTAGTGASPLNPLLGALSSANGGPTATHALLTGSPALNTGVNVALTTLSSSGIANPGATTFGVTDASKIPDGDFVIQIDSELMIVSSRNLGANLLTVSTRGAFGTVASSHGGDAPVYLGADQRGVGFIRSIGAPDSGAFELQKSVSIVADAASKLEGASGTNNFTFTVSRTGGTTGAVSMTYTVGGAAVNGTDFVGGTLPTGTANIADGSASTTVTIPVSGDTTRETSEAFTVTLSSPDNGYVVSDAPATSTITNDDFETDLSITVTDGVTTATPGGSVTYTITVSNAGPDPVTGATVADTFPAALTASWTAVGAGGGSTPSPGPNSGNINTTVNLPVGASVTFTATATISPAATGTLANTATVAVPAGVGFTDTNTANNSATDTDTLAPQADLAITVTDGVTTAIPGGTVTYTITASNPGPSNAPGATVADTFPAALTGITWAGVGAGGGTATASGSGNINDTVNLPAGGSVTYTVTGTIAPSFTGSLSNTATVAPPAGVTDPAPGNNSATDTDTLTPSANLAITVTDTPDPVVAGNNLTYTITASNAGPSTAASLSLSDTLPAGTTFVSIISPGGWSATTPAVGSAGTITATRIAMAPSDSSVFTLVVNVGSGVASGTVLSNTATITSSTTDPTPANNSGTATTTVAAQADLSITVTDGVTTATPGGTVTYTITASNAGPSNATGATVADTFPAGLTGITWAGIGAGGGTATASGSGNINDTVTLPAGGSVTYTVTATIATTASGTLSNTATVATPAGVTDPTPANNSATDTDTLSTVVSIAATDADADENTTGTGTWRVTRNGTVGAVTVQLEIDAGSTAAVADWSQSGAALASLAPGSTGSIIIPDGSGFVDITLTPAADIHAEAAETVRLNVTADAAYTVISPSNATVTIGANDFVVINANDAGEGTLRQAVANANAFASDDVITFNTPQNVVLTTGELNVQNNGALTIVDTAGSSISGNNSSRMFNTNGGSRLTLRGLWLKDGRASSNGGAIYGGGALEVINCALSGNTTGVFGEYGGAIYSADTLVVVSSTISGNSATNDGGGIFCTRDTSVVNSTLSSNSAERGGAIFNASGALTVVSSTITANTTVNGGGGVHFAVGSISLYNSILAGNTSTSGVPDLYASAVFDDSHNLIGVNTGHPLTNGTRGNIVGTAVTPANALLGPLANNGGPTLTHMLQDGSPAINAGDAAKVPADAFDLDGDLNMAEVLPVDQRGVGFARVIGTVVDIGAFEAFAFRPAIAATTVDEDTLSSTGLTVTPNTADGGLTTAFKITNIQNGTLYQNDGTTAITDGTFLTLTEGAAGLKFKPALNLNSPTTTFGFDAQATVDGADTGLRTGIATASITVTPVNDAPTVVAPGIADQTMTVGDTLSVALPAAFTDVEGDVLTYTVFNNSDSGKATATVNGTNVDLVAVAYGVTNITIQASDGSVGGTVTDTFQVAVGTVTPTAPPLPPAPGPGGYPVSGQTGTYNINTSVTNTTAFPIMGFRLTVDYSAHLGTHPSLRLYNSTNLPTGGVGYIDYPFPVAVGATVPIRLDFYTSNRSFPNPFTPVLSVTTLPVSQPSTAVPGPGVPATIRVNAGGQILLEWNSTPGQWYEIRWSDNMTEWYTSTIPVLANANKAQWVDGGAPFTRDAPGAQRFYIVNPRAAPTP